MFKECYCLGKILPSWRQARLALIPKKGKDISKVESYGPVSLLNVDYKHFTSIWVIRLNIFLGQYIRDDQIGVMKQRDMSNSIRQAMNLIETAQISRERFFIF